MKPGDMIRVNSSYFGKGLETSVRIYTNELCSGWIRGARVNETPLVLSHGKNRWDQVILRVLCEDGIRWVYGGDWEVLDETR